MPINDLMGYVHHCVYCGWSRKGRTRTMLSPRCERCSSALRASTPKEFERFKKEGEGHKYVPPSKSADVTGAFAFFVAWPFFLPILGVKLGSVTFAIPFVVLTFGAVRLGAAAMRDRAERATWIAMGVAAALAAASSLLAVAGTIFDTGVAPFYLGAAASVALLLGTVAFARRAIRGVRVERLVDGALVGVLVASVASWFVAIPGLTRGDAVLASVFVVDVAALLIAALSLVVGRQRIAWGFTVCCLFAAIGDAIVSAKAAGQIHGGIAITAIMWAFAGFALAYAADEAPAETAPPPSPLTGSRWIVGRVLLPLSAVLAIPALVLALWVARALADDELPFFGICFGVSLILAFGRQVYLLIDNDRAVTRERALLEDAMRRNKQLEALTGLATTMTQTLEEPPIIEQSLNVLFLAARATSAALMTYTDDGVAVRATTGNWQGEHAWADSPPAEIPGRSVQSRGGRQIVRLRLAARGNEIGYVTLIRGAGDPIENEELDLLGLLVDELAVAVQNARDYREKLEQAIRDPLTGLYNRRFFFEALEKEVLRSERYGSDVAIVLFDVDNFKLINDTLGHATGDDVLRRIGEAVERLIRPIDSFARIGGEEFALLLPETKQLDALLVAERIRTAISRTSLLPDRRVTLSGGVASCPQDASTREELHRCADAALYWSKRNGKDMCAVPNEAALAQVGDDDAAALSHLYGLVNVIDAQHLHTRDHSENVASYAVALAQALDFTPERIVRLRRAAFLHDVGKVAVNREMLDKPSKLTDDEFEQIKLHPTIGGMMLSHAGMHQEAEWVRAHHERIDGRGYPAGLAGDEIPLEARILFVADAFEAMTSDRPYHAGVDVSDALAELRKCAGTQFDPVVVDTFAGLIEQGALAVLALRNESGDAART